MKRSECAAGSISHAFATFFVCVFAVEQKSFHLCYRFFCRRNEIFR